MSGLLQNIFHSVLRQVADVLTHGCVAFQVFQFVVVHETHVTVAQGLCQSFGHFGFSLDDFGAGLPAPWLSFPVRRQWPWHGVPRPWPARCFCRRWPDSICRVAPMFLPTSISAMSIDRISKAVPASNPPFEHQFGDGVRVFQNLLVVFGRTDGRYDAFAYTGQDGVPRLHLPQVGGCWRVR